MSSLKIAAIVQLHCLSSAMRVLHPTYHFYSNVYPGHQSCIFSKIQILSLIQHSVSESCVAEFNLLLLHSLLKAKNAAWLSLINMDLAHTNCYHSILEKPQLLLNVESVMCVYS